MSDDPEIDQLLADAVGFTEHCAQRYGYVENRDVSMAVLPGALITRREYVDGPTKYTGAVHDGTGALVRSSLGFSEGDYEPLDPDHVERSRYEAAHRMRRALYGGTLYAVLGHFLFETVARLWHGVDFGVREGRQRGAMPIVFHSWFGFDLSDFLRNPMYRRVLGGLGITPGDIVMADIDLAVDVLYYPSPLSIYHVTLHPLMERVIDHLIVELLPRRLPAPLGRKVTLPARVFLSRSEWKANRRVQNERALEELFRAQGFAVVHPQALDPGKLVEILHGAEVVASTDGSQAHLAAFCRPGTRVILIDTRPVPTQFAIGKLRRLRALHIPVCTNGMWPIEDGRIDVSSRMERLLAAALKDDVP